MEGLATFDPLKIPSIGEIDGAGNFKDITVVSREVRLKFGKTPVETWLSLTRTKSLL